MAKTTRLDLDERMIVIGAFRYYLGRMTISVWGFTQWLIKNWSRLDEGTRHIILREIDEAIVADDEDRARPENSYKIYRMGHDCDRQSWLNVKEHAAKMAA